MDAYLFEKQDDEKVQCQLCRHFCVIKPDKRGICGVRENQSGILKTLVYGKLIARNIDPIEKKPLFHVMPGSLSYSIATVGCNFRCQFCQNADIAQMPQDRKGMIMGTKATPKEIVDDALLRGAKSISYTYTEPTVYFELAHDTAKLAHEKGLKNVFVTNGYMSEKALQMIAPYLHGANVDLKAFSRDVYKKTMGAKLEGVKETLIEMKRLGIFIEVTTLIVPGLNDDEKQLQGLSGFIAKELGPETPWHVSRFHPTYQMTDRPPTPVTTLLKAKEIGEKAGLYYVYTGNIPGYGGEDTLCYECGKTLIERQGFTVMENKLINQTCPFCSASIHGIDLGVENK